MTALQISPLSVLPQIRALGRHRGAQPAAAVLDCLRRRAAFYRQ